MAAGYERKEDFAKGVRAAREFAVPPVKNRQAYAKLILGLDSDSSGERLEAGDLGKKKDRPEERLRVARIIVEKTGCPPEIFGFSELGPGEADRLRKEFREDLKALRIQLLGEIEKVRRAQASPEVSGEPVAED